MSKALTSASATATFERFVAAINRHDVDALVMLMTPDHLFVDSLENQTRGAEPMRAAWQMYFAMCPDFAISVKLMLSEQQSVVAVGEAGGTILDTAWHTPAAWHAVIREAQVAEWRVFADNKAVCDILAHQQG